MRQDVIGRDQCRCGEEVTHRKIVQYEQTQEPTGDASECCELQQYVLVEDSPTQRRPRHFLDEPAGDEHRVQRKRQQEPRHQRNLDQFQPLTNQHQQQADHGETGGGDQPAPLTTQFGHFLFEAAHLLRITVCVSDLLQSATQLLGGHLGRVILDQAFFMRQRYPYFVDAVDS